jgi:hypothetical protein
MTGSKKLYQGQSTNPKSEDNQIDEIFWVDETIDRWGMTEKSLEGERNPIVAYREVSSALHWLFDIAGSKIYVDPYVSSLSPDTDDHGVMPIAELLMSLLNPMDRDYAQRKLPQPTPALIRETISNLLARFDQKALAGNPYLVTRHGDAVPSFLDAANYLVGALNSVLGNREVLNLLEKETRERIEECLVFSVKFIIDAQIVNPNGFSRGGGWSWCSPNEISADANLQEIFPGSFPAQTYFTSQAMISLMEVLFDNADFAFRHDLQSQLLDCIARSKQFLLDTIKHPTRQGRAGWGDFSIAENADEEGINLNMRTDGSSSMETVGDPWQSLYALECLSYVNFYLQDVPTVSRIRRVNEDLFSEFETFSDEQSEGIKNVFGTALSPILGDKKMYQKSATIRVSYPLNSPKDSAQEVVECFYVDGTVAYNALNALNFCSRFFEVDDADFEEWQTSQDSIIDGILTHSFVDPTFQHTALKGDDEIELPAIYATRTAIAALLSWGVEPPDSFGMEGLDPEVRGLVARLFELTIGQPPAPSSAAVEPIDQSAVQILLEFALFAGLLCASFDDADRWADPDLATHTDMVKSGAKWERHEFIRANSQFLIVPFQLAFLGDTEAAIKAAEKAINHPLLFNVFRQELQDLVADSFDSWPIRLKSLPEKLIEALKEIGGFILEDRFIWR